jgi:hypothetical protein
MPASTLSPKKWASSQNELHETLTTAITSLVVENPPADQVEKHLLQKLTAPKTGDESLAAIKEKQKMLAASLEAVEEEKKELQERMNRAF